MFPGISQFFGRFGSPDHNSNNCIRKRKNTSDSEECELHNKHRKVDLDSQDHSSNSNPSAHPFPFRRLSDFMNMIRQNYFVDRFLKALKSPAQEVVEATDESKDTSSDSCESYLHRRKSVSGKEDNSCTTTFPNGLGEDKHFKGKSTLPKNDDWIYRTNSTHWYELPGQSSCAVSEISDGDLEFRNPRDSQGTVVLPKCISHQSVRLTEREQYRLLLQQCTTEPLFSSSRTENGHNFNTDMKDSAVQTTQRSRNSSWTRSIHEKAAVRKERLQPFELNNMKSRLMESADFSRGNPKTEEVPFSILTFESTSRVAPSTNLPHSFSGRVSSLLRPNPTVPNFKSSQSESSCRKKTEDSNEADVMITKVVESPARKRPVPCWVKESNFFSPQWLKDLRKSLDDVNEDRFHFIEREKILIRSLEEQRREKYENYQRKLRERIKLPRVFVDEEEDSFVELPFTPEMEDQVDNALRASPPNEILVEGFNLSIRRRDMETLAGLNWLNDEIINFFMNLIMERGKNDNYPSVYAFNTFFYSKLLSQGYGSLKRWTRRVDVFSYEFLIVPIHLGVHWCLAVIDFKLKKIQYYDSMGGQNNECLQKLRSYLQDESLDKKSKEFDLTNWTFEIVKGIPQQMNGSDCGVFTCRYAECITRKAKITFNQANMPYLRRRTVYEILNKRLL